MFIEDWCSSMGSMSGQETSWPTGCDLASCWFDACALAHTCSEERITPDQELNHKGLGKKAWWLAGQGSPGVLAFVYMFGCIT